jgi:hypothetical protein
VITGRAAPGTFAISGAGLSPTPAETEAHLLAYPIYGALRAVDPDGWLVVREAWVSAVEEGQPETEAVAITRVEMAKARRQARLVMPDDTAVAVAKQVSSEMKAIQAVDPEACHVYAVTGNVDLRKYFSPTMMKADLELNERLLLTAAARPAARVEVAVGEPLVQKAVTRLRNPAADAGPIATSLRPETPHDQTCPIVWTLYDAVLNLPDGENASAIRYLMDAK